MSWLSKQLKSAKKMVTHPKAWAGNALQTGVQIAPYAAGALAIPGVGAGLGKAASAIGLGGLRRVLPGGGNIKVPKELDMGKIFPGLPGMGGPEATSGGGGGFDWGSLLGGAGSFLKNNAVDIGIGGLAGYQALNAANASKRAGQLQDKAISGAEKRWGDNEALRTEGRRRLLNPTRPDLSSVYADPTNPFAKRATPTAPSDATPGIPIGAALGKLSGYARPSIPIAQRLGKKLLASGALQPNTPIADRMGVDILASGALGGGGGIANKIANARKRLLPAPY